MKNTWLDMVDLKRILYTNEICSTILLLYSLYTKNPEYVQLFWSQTAKFNLLGPAFRPFHLFAELCCSDKTRKQIGRNQTKLITLLK